VGELAQLGDEEADVVTGTAQDGVEDITERVLERVPAQAPVHLHVADGRLDGASAPGRGLERAGDAALLARPRGTSINLGQPA